MTQSFARAFALWLCACAAALCIVLTAWLGGYTVRGPSRSSGESVPAGLQQTAVAAFLATYVQPDGRVYRPDQGGDTVSEGQAYGLLLAEVAGRDDLVMRIWRWTQVHLQVPDGLFAWHADASGHILDPESAGDADLLIAWALLRYAGPGAAGLHQDGRRVASAVLTHEVATAGGIPVLAAGPWATGRPFTVDPSYWSLPALTGLASLTGNKEWLRMADGAVALIARMTRNGALLPPDWAEVFPRGEVLPEPAPYDAGPQSQYGLDAQRTTVWFAASCVPQARTLAARWWRLLRPASRSRAMALTPDGMILNPTSSALPLVAAAAAAQAADAATASRHLLSLAGSLQRRDPRYYGGAWAALGSVLLGSHLLSGC
jgi:endoglucanase